jgi:hypothetical protein
LPGPRVFLNAVSLQELLEHFGEVALVDIQKMPAARKLVWRSSNITLETLDLTGFLERLQSGSSRTPPNATGMARAGLY